MSKVEDIQAAVKSLSEEEYRHFRTWFSEQEWQKWADQIQRDSELGRLEFLIDEAAEEKAKSQLQDL